MKRQGIAFRIGILLLAVCFSITGVGWCDAPSGLAADGRGWGGVALGMPYDEVKAALKQKGFSIDTTLGMYHTEDYVYSRTFAASSGQPGKNRLVFTLNGDMWEKKVYNLNVEVDGVDGKTLLSELTRIHGEPTDRSGEDNYSWTKGPLFIKAFLPEGLVSITFTDRRIEEKIAKQSQIDQGLIRGEKTPPSPEVIFYNTNQKAFVDALPPAPDGWETTEETKIGRTIRQVTQYTDRPMHIEFERTYVNRSLEEEFEKKQAAMLEAKAPQVEAARSALERKVEDLQPKIDALGEKMRAAAERGNFKEIERLQKELEALQTGAFSEGATVAPAEESTEFHIPAGFDSRCRVSLDSYSRYPDEEMISGSWVKGSPVDGNIPVFVEEKEVDPRQYVRSSLCAFVGPVECRLSDEGLSVKRPDLNKVPHMGIACIRVRISAGTPGRARRTLERIDWKKLRSLVTPGNSR